MNELTGFTFAPQVPARFSIEEFMRLIDSGALDGMGKIELVEGVIVRMSPALGKHMRLQREIFERLLEIMRDDPSGRIAQFELTVQLGSSTLRDIDVAIVSKPPADDEYGDPATVSLAIEVSNTTLDYDLNDKARAYAAWGIPHYWVVDVENARTHIMTTPLDGDYAERRLFPFGEPLPVPGTDRTITIG
jgi:Uma2 family endonuclease